MIQNLRIISVIPRNTPATGGNATSASRVASQLAAFGWASTIVREGEPLPHADMVLAWNAIRVGERLLDTGLDPRRIIAVWTGTDLWEGLTRDPRVLTRLKQVGTHIVFTESGRERLLELAPHWAGRIQVIAPGVEDTMFRPGHAAQHSPVVLVAGGIRAVKRTHWAIDLVERVRARGVALELWVAGPMRETEEVQLVTERAATRPWVRLWGEVERSMMPSLYCQAAVVLNTSAIEGVSNALMEAMACGSAVVATRIPGNAALIKDGETGWLFADADEFDTVISRVVADKALRQQVGYRARRRMVTDHGALREASMYAHVLGQQMTRLSRPTANSTATVS